MGGFTKNVRSLLHFKGREEFLNLRKGRRIFKNMPNECLKAEFTRWKN